MANVPVVILAGQSNASYGGIDNEIVQSLEAEGNAFEFVKVAVGGTSLFPNSTQDWSPGSKELFSALVTAIAQAARNVTAQGDTPVFDLLWVQGEADTSQTAAAYKAALTAFIADLRTTFGADISVTISSLPYASTVRTAQFEVASSVADTRIIDTTGAVTWDGVHYGKATRDGIADEFLAMNGITAATITGYHNLLAGAAEFYNTVHQQEDVTAPLYQDFAYTSNDISQAVSAYSGDDSITTGAGNDIISTGDNNDYVSSGGGNDTVDAGAHDDTVHGGAGNDSLIGYYGSDLLYGDDGDDTISGGDENDTIYGGAGNDRIDGGAEFDTVVFSGNLANYTVTASGSAFIVQDNRTGSPDGTDTLTGVEWLQFADQTIMVRSSLDGTSGADSLIALTNEIVYGLDGNDTLTGSGTGNIIYGGNGDDQIWGAGGTNTLDGGAGNDKIYGGAGTETITGNDGNDYLNGGGGNDSLSGGTGNDSLDGGADTDTLAGGMGDDLYIVDNAGDVVIENAGEGSDTINASVSYDLSASANVEDLTLSGTANLSGFGNGLDNVVTGNAGNNALTGAAGNDTLSGGAGNDTLDGGYGNDSLVAGSGNDVVTGGAGNDTIDGGSGVDTLAGGPGDDVYAVDNSADVVTENPGEGYDKVNAIVSYDLGLAPNIEVLSLVGSGNPTGGGNALDNVITGNTGNNLLTGMAGNDTLNGNAGDDTLNGGTGNDSLIGGAGNDTAVYSGASSQYTVVHFGLYYYIYDNSVGAAEGMDTLNGVEFVRFSDTSLILASTDTGVLYNGTTANNAYTGTDYGDVLSGLGGNDTLNGGAGNDRLDGGDGNDSLVGGAGNDQLTGGAGNDTLLGGDGNDTIFAGSGSDIIDGGAGSNILSLATLINGVHLNLAVATVQANPGAGAFTVANIQSVIGTAFNDTLTGDSHDNSLSGGAGNDVLDGGVGNDTLAGGTGNDVYVIDSMSDVVIENPGEGNDTIDATINYSLSWAANVEALVLTGTANISGSGNAFDNAITGNAGKNLLSGGAGNDTLQGAAGADTLIGGAGNDVLNGGDGADVFAFNAASTNGTDQVTDFAHGVDTLLFTGSDYGFASGHALSTAEFITTTTATAVGTSAQFIWDTANHTLYWDHDGAGHDAAVAIATFTATTTLTASDIHFG